ncbi:MAG TPA: EcsC family protein [Aeromicrobium sp.]|nr:EcsC family protein [Aeromicrobium sp.]
MSMKRTVGRTVGKRVAPSVASQYVRAVLDRAIDGVGPLRSAAASADSKLVDAGGDVETAISKLIRLHVTLAGAQGFVTNLGGVAALAVALPANVAGVTLVQCHLIAGIAHLRGYDLNDPRVRNAILVCMLGEDSAAGLVKKSKIPASPLGIATAAAHDPTLDEHISREVTTDLIARTAGRRAVTLIGRRVPLLGGFVGGGSDALMTWQLGRYAMKELVDRNLRR